MSRSNHYFLAGLVVFISFSGTDRVWAQKTAEQAFNQQQYEAAIEAWDQMLMENPELLDAHYNKGNAQFRLGDTEAAIKAYEQALGQDDKSALADVYYNLGNAYLQQQDLDKARELYKQALRLRPHDEDAKANLELINRMPPPPPQDQNSSQDQQKQDQQDQNQQQDGEQDQQDQQDQQEQDQQDKQEQDQQQQEQDQQQSEQQESESEMNPEEKNEELMSAQQLLDALKDRETENMREQIRLKTSGQDNEKDW